MEYKLTFKEYSEALKKDKLIGLKCKGCGELNVPPKMVCPGCSSTELEKQELTGKGEIVTFTTINVAAEGRENETPYIVVMVKLDEGPWLMGNLIDIDPTKADMSLIGRRVKMGHKVYPGDKFSAGESVRPLFAFEN